MRVFYACLPLLALLACGGKAIGSGPPDNGGDPTSAQLPSERAPVAGADPNDVWLAFGASTSKSRLFVMRADGSQLRELATGVTDSAAPAFSANGKALAFSGADHLYVMDLATGKTNAVTAQRGGTPAWSPDGKLLAFTRDVDIYVVGADGPGERRLLKGPPPGQPWYANYGHPVFTLDGNSILFDRAGAIERIDLDGGNQHPVFSGATFDYPMVALSPDGTQAAFGTACGGFSLGELYIVPIANIGQACTAGTHITGTRLNDARPAWGANGVVAYSGLGSLDVWTVPAAGGTPVNVMTDAMKVTTGGGYVSELAWSPPGTILP